MDRTTHLERKSVSFSALLREFSRPLRSQEDVIAPGTSCTGGGLMRGKQKIVWVVAVAFILICMAAITTPRLTRSRVAPDKAFLLARSSAASTNEAQDGANKLSFFEGSPDASKKLIENAELGLVVRDVRAAADQIRQLTVSNHGEIDRAELIDASGGLLSATLVVRVPASGLDAALAGFKRLAVRIEREQVNVRDVTQEFYDNDAHLRNLHAEEQQYLLIMQQAHTVKDTLEVSKQLSDVRDRIERLQVEIQFMKHDVEMSVVTIVLREDSDARAFGIRWQPVRNAEAAARQLLDGLGEWINWIVAVLIQLPLIVLWAATVGAILWTLWKVSRKVWLQFLKPKSNASPVPSV